MKRPLDSGRMLGVAGTLFIGLLTATVTQAAAWPQVELPADASVYSIDSVTTIDGLPLKMQGFVSRLTVAELAAWYRSKMGRDVVENSLGQKRILGQRKGEYFISVQLEPIAGKTRAIAAVSHLTAGLKQRLAPRTFPTCACWSSSGSRST